MGKSKAAVSIDAAFAEGRDRGLRAPGGSLRRSSRRPSAYVGGTSEVLRKLRSENPDDLSDEEAQRIAYEELDAFRPRGSRCEPPSTGALLKPTSTKIPSSAAHHAYPPGLTA